MDLEILSAAGVISLIEFFFYSHPGDKYYIARTE